MRVKTSELIVAALDWAVAKCEGRPALSPLNQALGITPAAGAIARVVDRQGTRPLSHAEPETAENPNKIKDLLSHEHQALGGRGAAEPG